LSTGEARSHEGCGEDAAPYVLGALTEAEHEAFLAHLQSCPGCREEVSALQSVVNSLPAAVPQVRAPEALRDRVMATVQSEAVLRNAGQGEPAPASRRPPRPVPWRRAFGGLVGVAAVVLIALLAFGGGSASSPRVVSAQVSVPAARATLRISSGQGTLQIARLPKTLPGHVYQVWVKRSGAPEPTDALFTVSSAGAATVAVPGSLRGVSVVMVTAEPDGGSREPTTAPVITATL
jgi:anti-sigma-K factor RskA